MVVFEVDEEVESGPVVTIKYFGGGSIEVDTELSDVCTYCFELPDSGCIESVCIVNGDQSFELPVDVFISIGNDTEFDCDCAVNECEDLVGFEKGESIFLVAVFIVRGDRGSYCCSRGDCEITGTMKLVVCGNPKQNEIELQVASSGVSVSKLVPRVTYCGELNVAVAGSVYCREFELVVD